MKKCIVFIEASLAGAGAEACAQVKAMGLNVVLFCQSPAAYPTAIRDHCNDILSLNTLNEDALFRAVCAVSKKFLIVGLTTTSNRFIAQPDKMSIILGLPGNRPETMDTLLDRALLRASLESLAPELNPPYCVGGRASDMRAFVQRHGFPLMAKPQRHTGLNSKMVSSQDELAAFQAQCKAQNSEVLLETVQSGDEYSLYLLKPADDELMVVGAIKRIRQCNACGEFVQVEASFPSDEALTQRMAAAIAPLLEKVGFEIGIMRIDYMLSEDQFKILTLRPGLGEDAQDCQMIASATGLSLIQALLITAQGRSLPWIPTQQLGVALHRLTIPSAGYVLGLENQEDITQLPGVESLTLSADPEKIYTPDDAGCGEIGSVLVTQPSAEEARQLARKISAMALVSISATRV